MGIHKPIWEDFLMCWNQCDSSRGNSWSRPIYLSVPLGSGMADLLGGAEAAQSVEEAMENSRCGSSWNLGCGNTCGCGDPCRRSGRSNGYGWSSRCGRG